jgi:UDP-glucose-4-epimerase GalE
MVLVVGGAGYVGSHVCHALRAASEPHLVLDNLEKGHRQAVEGSPLVVGDIRDPNTVKRVLAEHMPDTVMHFAACIEVGESVRDPAKYYWNNLYGVLVLLEAMREASVERFVFSSTAAVFGEPHYVPIDENHPTCPTSPYGDTKLAVERMLRAFDVAYGIRSVALRYFNASGAQPGANIGEDHDPETHLIPRAILAALGRVPPLVVFGTDYDTPDGTCVRDYVHVSDLARAHLLALAHLRADGPSRAFNLGGGEGRSVREVIESVERVSGRKVPHSFGDRRPGDPARLVASSKLIQSELGWRPRFVDIDEIVSHAWVWHSAHPEGYRS